MAKKKPDPESTSTLAEEEVAPAPKKLAFGLGHLKDHADERFDVSSVTPLRAHLGAPRNLPGEASLEGYLRGIRNQESTSSCVGHAIGTAADTRMRRLGLVAPDPSRVAIYTFGRVLDRSSKSAPLQDAGCFPRHAMQGIKDFGVPAEGVWPFDEAKVNEELPWDVQQAASVLRLAEWYLIDSTGDGRVEAVCHAIAHGYPVVFGTDVDGKFMDHAGGDLVTPAAKQNEGGHMLCIIGYETVDGQRVLRGVNSWGTTWGDRGLFNMGADFLTDPRAGDFYALVVGGA